MGWNLGPPAIPRCFFMEVIDLRYLVLLFVLTIILPSLFMAIVYVKIFVEVRRQVSCIVKLDFNILHHRTVRLLNSLLFVLCHSVSDLADRNSLHFCQIHDIHFKACSFHHILHFISSQFISFFVCHMSFVLNIEQIVFLFQSSLRAVIGKKSITQSVLLFFLLFFFFELTIYLKRKQDIVLACQIDGINFNVFRNGT